MPRGIIAKTFTVKNPTTKPVTGYKRLRAACTCDHLCKRTKKGSTVNAVKKILTTIAIIFAVIATVTAVVFAIERENITFVARLNKSGVSYADAALACGEPHKVDDVVLDADAALRTVVFETRNRHLSKSYEVIWVVRDDPHLTYHTIRMGACWHSVIVAEVPPNTVAKALTDAGEARLARTDSVKQVIDDTNPTTIDIALEALGRGLVTAFFVAAVMMLVRAVVS